MKPILQIIGALLLYGLAIGTLAGANNTGDRADQKALDPLNATYRIEGQPIALVDGCFERPAATDSAMMVRTAVWKQPVYADLDGDGDEDAALVLIHDPGGSGTFYYVAAAINFRGQYQRTNTVLLGDRIAPQELAIRNRTIVVDYADRRPDEPFSATPPIHRSMVLALQDGQLLATPSLGEREQTIRGQVTIGHEVRCFKPCHEMHELWLLGASPALKAIIAAYRRAMPEPMAYRPVFMVLVGERVDPPAQGFGADYRGAFRATRLVQAAPEASCSPESDSAKWPESARRKIAFDASRLDDAGLVGPPGGKRALSYEFCIPDRVDYITDVQRIDSTVRFFSASPGRIGCGTQQVLCIGSTQQDYFAAVLRQLTELPYVDRIEQAFFE